MPTPDLYSYQVMYIKCNFMLHIPEIQQRQVFPDHWYTSVLHSWRYLAFESVKDGTLQLAPDKMWGWHNYGALAQTGICIVKTNNEYMFKIM